MPREPDSPLTRGEYGLRLNKEFSGLDLTLFYLNYYDHSPVYQIQFTGPTNIALMPVYNLLQTGGVTATVDLGGYLIRSEIISNMERTFNTFDGVSLAEVKLNETIYVLGLDLPPIDKWLIAFQYSHSAVADGFKNASASNNLFARTQKQSVSSVRISKTFKGDIEMETQLTHFNEDSSQLMQAQIKLPISNRSEVLLGLDKFDGNENSSLGRFKKASRVWVMFQVALKE